MAKRQPGDDAGRKVICTNRRALHDYSIQYRLEAGLVLLGTEVKSLRQGRANLSDGYVTVRKGEAFLLGAHIAEYEQANRFNHDPLRDRKLLLHHREIHKLWTRLRQKGLTAIPLRMYFKEGRAKVEIGLGTGKRQVDRRQDVKERQVRRELDRVARSRTRKPDG